MKYCKDCTHLVKPKWGIYDKYQCNRSKYNTYTNPITGEQTFSRLDPIEFRRPKLGYSMFKEPYCGEDAIYFEEARSPLDIFIKKATKYFAPTKNKNTLEIS